VPIFCSYKLIIYQLLLFIVAKWFDFYYFKIKIKLEKQIPYTFSNLLLFSYAAYLSYPSYRIFRKLKWGFYTAVFLFSIFNSRSLIKSITLIFDSYSIRFYNFSVIFYSRFFNGTYYCYSPYFDKINCFIKFWRSLLSINVSDLYWISIISESFFKPVKKLTISFFSFRPTYGTPT
jgi:hypothetical protein